MDGLIPADLSDATLWAIIVGFITPLALKWIVNADWKKQTKAIVSFVFSAIVGTITAIIAGAYEGLGIPAMILLTFVVSITAYQNFWSKIGVTNRNTENEEKPTTDKAVG
jgi:FtsH-binding integral membrane protein